MYSTQHSTHLLGYAVLTVILRVTHKKRVIQFHDLLKIRFSEFGILQLVHDASQPSGRQQHTNAATTALNYPIAVHLGRV